jgi:hypothetical protein
MAKNTLHWSDDHAPVFGSDGMGFCGPGDCMGKKARSERCLKERCRDVQWTCSSRKSEVPSPPRASDFAGLKVAEDDCCSFEEMVADAGHRFLDPRKFLRSRRSLALAGRSRGRFSARAFPIPNHNCDCEGSSLRGQRSEELEQ